MSELPVRGPGVRRLGLRLPPERMAPLQRGRPLKRWRYLGVYRPDLMLCVGDARVAGVPQRWWALALPGGELLEGTRGIAISAERVRVRGVLELELGTAADAALAGRPVEVASPHARPVEVASPHARSVEVASPHARSWIWTRKSAPLHVRGRVTAGGRSFELDGDDGFLDESAGYHARHTAWRWSAGVGRAADGRRVAWNLVDGVHDAPSASERTVWIDGQPHEVPPQAFAPDLSRVGELGFREWSARESSLNLLVMRNRYRQPFGEFSGELPGGIPLAEGYGVMEEHDVLW